MLETLMHIGKTLRSSKRLKHHRYIKPAPLSDPKSPVIYVSLPVDDDFQIDVSGITEIKDENVLRNGLYYLTFKSSETDNSVKYIFGDILYGINKKGNEVGYYRMDNGKAGLYGRSSFFRGKEDANAFAGTMIEKFRASFERQVGEIESLLKEHGQGQSVFLHFDFSGKHWYEFEQELEAVNRAVLDYFVEEQNGGIVLRNFMYKTLISGDSLTPGFDSKNAYKTKLFANRDEVMDLLYAINHSKKALISERDIKVVVLPKGDDIGVDDIETFFARASGSDEEQAEAKLDAANIDHSGGSLLDSFFDPFLTNTADNITQFDFVFSKRGSKGLDVDMIEFAGLKRSFLAELGERIRKIREPLSSERNDLYPKRPKQYAHLGISQSFLNVLGDVTKDKKKYQSHLFKVLPQIYTGTYYRDDVLLPAFIEKTEYNIRRGASDFNLLKYDYYFLAHLRNTEGDNPVEGIKAEKSYQAGLLLGKMAQPLRREIASFEKNYVGLLSRRISDKQGLLKLANFVNEKLAIHDVAYPNLKQASVQFAEMVSNMSEAEYRKNECAFGFFESYFGRFQEAANETGSATDGAQSNGSNR